MRDLVGFLPWLVVALPLAGCAGVSASPIGSQPVGDDLQSNLEARGVTIDRLVVGDAGCPNRGYDDQAVRMDVTFGATGQAYSIYLIQWPDLKSFTEDAFRDPPGDAHPFRPYRECVNDYVGHHMRPVTRVESFPWRAYGPELPETLRQTLLDSMHAAGGI